MIEHFELAQSSGESLPGPRYCCFCSNRRLISLRRSVQREFGPRKFIRLSTESFPDLKGPQLEVLSNLCAHPSEDFFVSSTIEQRVRTNQWVRTSILSDKSAEELCSPTLIEEDRCQLMSIHSNVLPCDPYWTKLRAMRDGASKRVHFPSSVLQQALQEQKTLMTKLSEWRNLGDRCDIGKHGLDNFGDENNEKLFWTIQTTDVAVDRIISRAGADGDIWLVKWKGGMFARKDRTKSFRDPHAKDIELEVLERFSHPHIVYGFGESKDPRGISRASLFMEYMQSNLFKFIVQNGQDGALQINRPFSREDSLDVLLQIARAMKCLHTNGVIHGDLKSQNILMSDFEISGNVRYFLVKVADFGDAQFISNDEADFKPSGPGTTGYAAPELLNCRGNSNSTFRFPSKIDVYSFGCVAYEVLTGHEVRPCQSDTKRVVAGELIPSDTEGWETLIKEYRYPLQLIKLVESCYELDPEKRPSFSQICVEIEKCKPKVLLERGALHLWKFIAVCICTLACPFILYVFCSLLIRFVLGVTSFCGLFLTLMIL